MRAPTHVERGPHLSPVITRKRMAEQAVRRSGEQGGMTLLVEGLPGLGKTFLLNELVAAAGASDDWQITSVRADEIESSEPYSFIERFVASFRVPDWQFVPDVQEDPVLIARECIQRLVNEPDSPTRLIVIDDAQWVDFESQRVIRYMIPRVTRRGALLAFGIRTPHQPESFGEFLRELVQDDPVDLRYHILPLSTQEISAYALDQFGISLSPLTAKRVLDATGGSFLRVDTMLSALTPDEIAQLQLAWDAPIRANLIDNDLLLHQYRLLDPTSRRTCEIVCLADHELSHRDLHVAAAALGEEVSLEPAILAGVLSESGFGSAILPRHALLSHAIRNDIPPERSRAVFQALAKATTGFRSLRHKLLGAEKWDEELHTEVDEFVSDAVSKGNLGVASEVLRAALEVTSESRAELLSSLALVHLQAKTGYLILDLIEEINDLPPTVLNEFISIVISAHQIGAELPTERVQTLLSTPTESPDDRTVIAFFAFMVVILSMRSMDLSQVPMLIAQAKQLINMAPDDPSELQDQRLSWMLEKQAHILVLDTYLMVQDQMTGRLEAVAEELPRLAQRIDESPNGPLKVDAMVAVAGAELSIGNLVRGRDLAQQAVEMIGYGSEPWAAGTARLLLADCLVLQGELDAATELMSLTEEITYTALDINTRFTWANLRIIIAAITGQEDAPLQIKRARAEQEAAWEGYAPDLPVLAECELARSLGDHAGVLKASSGERIGRLNNTRNGFLTYRAHALLETGRITEAQVLIDQLAQWRGTRWQEYWGSLDWLRARNAEITGDPKTARWHYEAAIQNRHLPLPLGLTLADYGAFLISQGEHEAGKRTIRSAIEVLEQIGAEGYLSKLREQVPSLESSDRTPEIDTDLLTSLTEREKQIVEHLVKGRSNNQIAESLVVSVTTVRSHVSNVLRKLHVSSRGEVAKLFRNR